jgi:CubicO group peptidase (beta-lactamase class C family)
MPTRAPESRLSGLVFADPQADPAWAHEVVPASGGAELPKAVRDLDVVVEGAGTSWSLDEWRRETYATSLLVVDGGTVVHEWYADGLDAGTRFLGASMSKSALAHLVGRAVESGVLSLDDDVVGHVPELRGSGYARARVRDLLTMTSGVDWVEDHRDPESLASRLLGCFFDGGDSRALLGLVGAGVVPGTRYAYCTADSQVLDWVRERATGRSFAEDLALLWADLGCTEDAYVGVDGAGVALAGGAVAATTRDWARIGLLAAEPSDWADLAARPAYPFLEPGRLPSALSAHVGFGCHWWPLDADGRRVAADGSRGQFVAVDRVSGAVVVKTSLWPYEDPWADRHYRDLSYLGLHALLDQMNPGNKEPERHRP